MIIEMDMYSEIRIRYANGESIRSIALKLGISRQTVNKYCKGATHPEVRKEYKRDANVVTDKVKRFILNCFQEDEDENLRKQKHTARQIYKRLVIELEFQGSYSTIRQAVRELKAERTVTPQCFVPLSFAPGEAVQVDWGEATIYLNGQKTKGYMFCGRLCNSCDIFVQFYLAANAETFLEAQQLMFDFFAGIPRRVIFDNAKIAVKDGFGLHAKPQNRYLAFSAHYAFATDFCNPARGNEKGLVENLVGYARRNFMVPVPRVTSVEELNRQLRGECLSYRQNHKVQNRQHPVMYLYHEERKMLAQIPDYRYDTSKTVMAKVDDFSTVRFEKNNYSVPTKYLRKEVTVKGYANSIRIMYSGHEIATYSRIYGSGKTEYQLKHYLDLLERKPRAVFQAKPVQANVTQELLEWGRQLPGGNKEMVKLLRLCVDYGEEHILALKHSLPEGIVPTVDMVRSCLHETAPAPVNYLEHDVPVNSTDLTKYDERYGVVYQ